MLAQITGKDVNNAVINSAFNAAANYINQSLGWDKNAKKWVPKSDDQTAGMALNQVAALTGNYEGEFDLEWDVDKQDFVTKGAASPDATVFDRVDVTGALPDDFLTGAYGSGDRGNVDPTTGTPGATVLDPVTITGSKDAGSPNVVDELATAGLTETDPPGVTRFEDTLTVGTNPVDTFTPITKDDVADVPADIEMPDELTGFPVDKTPDLGTVNITGTQPPLIPLTPTDVGQTPVGPGVVVNPTPSPTPKPVNPTPSPTPVPKPKEKQPSTDPVYDALMQSTQASAPQELGDMYLMDLDAGSLDALLADRGRGSQQEGDPVESLLAQQSSAPQHQGSLEDLMKQIFG
jgi:hypothetical protein